MATSACLYIGCMGLYWIWVMNMNNLNCSRFLYIIIGFSGIIWFVVATIDGQHMQNFVSFMRPIPKVITVDLIFAGLFLRWGWRWKLLQGWLVPFPDLNGTWHGTIQTNWKDANGNIPGPIPTILTIKQTFSRISCVMRTGEMESHSYAEGFHLDPEKQIKRLCYSYTSRPNINLRHRSTPHDGTILFNIIEKPDRQLHGEYWTQRPTTGTVTLSFYSRELLETLPSGISRHPLTTEPI